MREIHCSSAELDVGRRVIPSHVFDLNMAVHESAVGPLVSGDIVTRLENGVYVYYAFHAGVWTPSEPKINVGEGFWINRSSNWKVNTSIWP